MNPRAHTLTAYQRLRRIVLLRRCNREFLQPSYWFPFLVVSFFVAFLGYSAGFVHGAYYLADEVDARFECQAKEVR